MKDNPNAVRLIAFVEGILRIRIKKNVIVAVEKLTSIQLKQLLIVTFLMVNFESFVNRASQINRIELTTTNECLLLSY